MDLRGGISRNKRKLIDGILFVQICAPEIECAEGEKDDNDDDTDPRTGAALSRAVVLCKQMTRVRGYIRCVRRRRHTAIIGARGKVLEVRRG